MDEGPEAEPVTPAVGEVGDVDIGIAGRLPLAPDQQSFLGRQQRSAGPKLLLAGWDSGSPCRDSGKAAGPGSLGRGGLGLLVILLCPQPGGRCRWLSLSLISFVVGGDWG